MSRKDAKDIIKEIRDLLNLLETDINSEGQIPLDAKVSRAKPKQKSDKSPVKSINELLATGFFNEHKTVTDLILELKKRANIFQSRVLSVALMRMVRKGKLSRIGLGTKKEPWAYKINL